MGCLTPPNRHPLEPPNISLIGVICEICGLKILPFLGHLLKFFPENAARDEPRLRPIRHPPKRQTIFLIGVICEICGLRILLFLGLLLKFFPGNAS